MTRFNLWVNGNNSYFSCNFYRIDNLIFTEPNASFLQTFGRHEEAIRYSTRRRLCFFGFPIPVRSNEAPLFPRAGSIARSSAGEEQSLRAIVTFGIPNLAWLLLAVANDRKFNGMNVIVFFNVFRRWYLGLFLTIDIIHFKSTAS